MLCEIFEDCMFVEMLDLSTPGSPSYLKYVMTLFSECSVGAVLQRDPAFKKVRHCFSEKGLIL